MENERTYQSRPNAQREASAVCVGITCRSTCNLFCGRARYPFNSSKYASFENADIVNFLKREQEFVRYVELRGGSKGIEF
jgi:hypothetical protein